MSTFEELNKPQPKQAGPDWAQISAEDFNKRKEAVTPKPQSYHSFAESAADNKIFEERNNKKPEPTTPASPVERVRPSYADMVRYLYPEESNEKWWEDKDARMAKRRKRDAIINGLGDAFSAMANLGATASYATPMQLSSLSEQSQQRYDKIKAERDARKETYRAAYLKAMQADEAAKTAAAKERAANVAAAQKAATEERRWQAEMMYKLSRGQAQDKYRRDKLAQDYDLGTKRVGASIHNTEFRATHGSGRGSGGKKPYGHLYNPDTGKVEAFYSKADYEKAYYTYYPDDAPAQVESHSTHLDEKGNVTTTTTKTEGKLTGSVVAKAEAKAKQKNK